MVTLGVSTRGIGTGESLVGSRAWREARLLGSRSLQAAGRAENVDYASGWRE